MMSNKHFQQYGGVSSGRQMDSLAMDAKAAREAGMSYGMWKVLHPETKQGNEAMVSASASGRHKDMIYTITCAYCGRTFHTKRKQKKYCDDVCKNAKNSATYHERHKKSAPAAMESEVEACPA